jgi:protoporphyrinogen oxidase
MSTETAEPKVHNKISINPKGKRCAVIGGGMMGMAVALRLAQHGQTVTLFEAAPQLGGLTSAWKLGDIVWDKFYHVILNSDSFLLDLLAEIGLRDEIKWVQTRTGFYSDGKLHSLSSSIEFLKFPPLSLYQKFRLGSTIFFGSKIKNWKSMEQIGVETWLRRWSGKSTFEKIWLPLLRAKLGDSYKRVSAAFIWAYIARMYKARRTGLKREMFGYVPGGYARILDRMATVLARNNVTIKTAHAVDEIRYGANSGTHHIQFSNGNAEDFDQVVITVPAPAISRMCPDLSADEKRRCDQVEYLGVMCASILMKQPLAGYYVTNITDTSIPLTGVIEMTAIVDPAELCGNSLIYLPKYMLTKDDGFSESDESIKERFLSVLEKMYPTFSRKNVVEFKVGRARQVMALPTLNFSESLPPTITSVPGLSIISSAQIVKGNLNVNETLQLAEESLPAVFSKLVQAAS